MYYTSSEKAKDIHADKVVSLKESKEKHLADNELYLLFLRIIPFVETNYILLFLGLNPGTFCLLKGSRGFQQIHFYYYQSSGLLLVSLSLNNGA